MSPPESPRQRLALNRARMVQWLDHDQARREAFSHSGLGQLAALPWVGRVAAHPLAGLAMNALTRWWTRPRAARPRTVSPVALGTGLGLLRRRPVLTLLALSAIGAAAWWTRFRRQPHAALNAPRR